MNLKTNVVEWRPAVWRHLSGARIMGCPATGGAGWGLTMLAETVFLILLLSLIFCSFSPWVYCTPTNSQRYWKLGHSLNCMWMWISSSCFKVKDANSYSDAPFVQLLSLNWREFAGADGWFLITAPVLASATCRPWQPTSAEMKTRAARELSPQRTQSTQMHTVIKLNLEKSSIILKGGCLVLSS